ncbi:MAG: T9SS type A sorting domain-containing protein [Bacteroidetes bacterium]|nr:T9SS type A sorting domain-containing protein [Bacteroidota bacterium]
MNKYSRFSSYLLFLIFNILLTGFFFIKGHAQIVKKGTTALPMPDHIIVLIYENHAYSSIIGSTAAPYLNALANDANAALFTQSYALAHPSQPNYLDLFSGSNQGVTNDNVPTGYPFTTANLARQLVDASKSFITYSEDMPSIGFNGASSGNYARKHNPGANWVGTGTNQISSTTNQPLTMFPAVANYSSLPTVAYVIPNQVNDMHNGTGNTPITAGDTWLHSTLDSYIQWALNNNSLLIVTFDEDDDVHGNQIATIFYGPMVQGGQYSEHINHYNVLRTIEDMYSLPYAGNASTANSITDCWRQFPAKVSALEQNSGQVVIVPNPASGSITFDFNQLSGENYSIHVTDLNGHYQGQYHLSKTDNTIDTRAYATGIYFYTVYSNNVMLNSGRLIIQH